MQQQPDHLRQTGASKKQPLTAMQMTMTRSNRPGGQGPSGGQGRVQEFLDESKIVAAGASIGLMTGVLVLIFKLGIAKTRHFTYEGPWANLVDWLEASLTNAGLMPQGIPADINLEFALYPLLGGILTTLMLTATKTLAGGDFGKPLSGQLEELQRGEPASLKRFAARETAAVVALGTGCSLGPEGPSVEIGVTTSRVVSQVLGLDQSLRKLLAAAGAAAGVSAGFNAPLTGVVFALEILLPSLNAAEIANAKEYAEAERRRVAVQQRLSGRKSSAEQPGKWSGLAQIDGQKGGEPPALSKATAGAVLTSAAIACLVVRSGIVEVSSERFTVANYALKNTFLELPFYMTLGILTGGVAASFRRLSAEAKTFYSGGTKGFEFMGKVPVELRPMLGATLCGIVATKYPGVLFFGYDIVNSLLAETFPYMGDTSTLLTLLVLKVSLTASCVGSGLMGGTYVCVPVLRAYVYVS